MVVEIILTLKAFSAMYLLQTINVAHKDELHWQNQVHLEEISDVDINMDFDHTHKHEHLQEFEGDFFGANYGPEDFEDFDYDELSDLRSDLNESITEQSIDHECDGSQKFLHFPHHLSWRRRRRWQRWMDPSLPCCPFCHWIVSMFLLPPLWMLKGRDVDSPWSKVLTTTEM